MASVKISELNQIFAITSDDFFPLVDSGSGTTYRATFNTLNGWMAAFGTCLNSISSSWASSSLSSSYATTSSWSSFALSSSHALTASYVDVTGFVPQLAVSASYALTASVLHGNGTSWENTILLSSSLKLSSSATIFIPRKRDVQNESISGNSIFFHAEYLSGNGGYPDLGTNGWSRAYYAEDIASAGRMVFEHGDVADTQIPLGPNLDLYAASYPGFLWQTFQNNGPYATGSLMFLKTDGNLYLRSATARNFTASVATGEGFHGTASWAVNLVGGLPADTALPIGSIVDYAGTTAPTDPKWHLCDGTSFPTAVSASLFAIIGYTWGGSGPNFNLPDLRKRFTLGANGVTTTLSGSVGNLGGGEGLANHFHLNGRPTAPILPGGSTYNDDVEWIWINSMNFNAFKDLPHAANPNGTFGGFFLTIGTAGDSTIQPNGSFSYNHTSGLASGFVLGSSFPFAFNIGAGTVANPAREIYPPYAACNKIIKVA